MWIPPGDNHRTHVAQKIIKNTINDSHTHNWNIQPPHLFGKEVCMTNCAQDWN